MLSRGLYVRFSPNYVMKIRKLYNKTLLKIAPIGKALLCIQFKISVIK